ncbi:MAG: anthranilate/aminodeoxychorismate synthase component II [Elusimicrobia bacterium RIFCSPLOWO2_01_FULL_59_12]|nr:MAG: anthranilate/aminodeoxychorismate synthase component II [Elusimicrobia bacterium RIFCSPLOWO2_01_FULL_59_12]
MILVIDNYDSFTYNLVQYFQEMDPEVRVYRNDAITISEIERLAPSHLVISPGPGDPTDAGISVDVIRRLAGTLPILGVCLGHQSIGYAFGGQVVRAKRLMHGKVSPILHDGKTLFTGLPQPFSATRYHSLLVDRATLPSCLQVSAWTAEGEIMGLRHTQIPVLEGVQFHPESIMTTEGKRLLKNFLSLKMKRNR